MKTYKGSCTATFSSMTQALKAQKALAAAAIPCSIIKSEQSSSLHGCAYGIEFNCNQKNNVPGVLYNAGITVKKWNTGD